MSEEYKKDRVLIGLFIVFVILVSAVFINNIFNHPVADDFSNYNEIIATIGKDNFAFSDAISAIGNLGIKTYQTWQGTYFANFLFFVDPLLFSLNAYKITMLVIQIFWLGGTLFFFKSLPSDTQVTKIRNLKLYFLFIIFSIMSMYSLGEGIYWFTGSILYIIPFTISLIFFGILMRYLHFRKTKHAIFAFVLAVILGGTSYVTGLVVGFVLLMLTIYSFIKKTDYRAFSTALLIVFCIGFAFNVFCPGNFMRIDSFEKAPLYKVALYAILNALDMLKHLIFETLFVPFLVIASPILVSFVRKPRFHFEKPILFSSLCLLCFIATFVPMAYSYGSAYQETRVKNIQLFYLAIMIIVCIINYLGSKKSTALYIKLENKNLIPIGILSIIVMIPAIGLENISGFGLLNDYIYMRNFQYDGCQDYINYKLSSSDDETIEISNCNVFPSSLHHYIITDDGWQTDAMEKYYHKTIKIIQ